MALHRPIIYRCRHLIHALNQLTESIWTARAGLYEFWMDTKTRITQGRGVVESVCVIFGCRPFRSLHPVGSSTVLRTRLILLPCLFGSSSDLLYAIEVKMASRFIAQ